jgi:FkbM family methyltransferase
MDINSLKWALGAGGRSHLMNPRWVANQIRERSGFGSNSFLRMVSGVIHVGANVGQERALYERFHLDVVWIEPIHEIFLELKRNLRRYPRQNAYEYLVTDKNGESYKFNISNNHGASSSILEIGQLKDIWSGIYYTNNIMLNSITLQSLITKEGVDIRKYDALVMDTQGSELLVLKGAENLLGKIRFVKTEVADFEVYEGCVQISDVDDFLRSHGFHEHYRNTFASRKQGGNCYDIVYRRPD